MDFADARRRMVDGQLRPSRVTDPRLIAAMGGLPRERFLPPELRARAYLDEDVKLGHGGRALTEPMVLARLVQLAAIREGDRALATPAGTGYGAAVMGLMGARVVAVEEEEALLALAREALAATVPPAAVRLLRGEVARGYPAGAPYEVILIEGEVPEVPRGIADQLAEGGRLVTVLSQDGRAGHAVLGRRLGGTLTVTRVFDCATTPLAPFAAAPGFVF